MPLCITALTALTMSVDILVTATLHAAVTAVLRGVATHTVMGVLLVGTTRHHTSSHLIQTGRLKHRVAQMYDRYRPEHCTFTAGWCQTCKRAEGADKS